MISVSTQEFHYLKDIIRKKTEIALGDNKKYLVETRLSSLVLDSGCLSFAQFCKRLSQGPDADRIMDRVVEAITTNETYWFRDDYPFYFIRTVFLPAMAREIHEGKRDRINIWSAASSYGQEAYSVAMTALEFQKTNVLGKQLTDCLTIVGTDISTQAIEKARLGVYTENDMGRGLPHEMKTTYFQGSERGWAINDRVKQLVNFSVFNLQAPLPISWGVFDIILLRNVIIYFADPFKKILLDRVSRKLARDGVLFLGTGESVSGYSDRFRICSFQKAKYYQLDGNQ
ncbi:MAG: protein-glutamate O-methyltransferase CheR [Pseudomonadota bacterium]